MHPVFRRLVSLTLAVTIVACAGTSGKDGTTALIRVDAEAEGEHCAQGGTRIAVGVDTNHDGVLGDDEVQSTSFVCNGIHGHDGNDGSSCTVTAQEDGSKRIECTDGTTAVVRDGTSGTSTLLRTDVEPVGEHCAFGGIRVQSGADTDGDMVLSDTEVEQTTYVCSGLEPPNCTSMEGNYLVRNQTDLVLFAILGCTRIEGDLTIQQFSQTDLHGLDRLTEVGGNVTLTGTTGVFTSLHGLDALRTIGGSFTLTASNAPLADLTGLNALTSIGGSFVISANKGGFSTLTGLDSLTTLGGKFSVVQNTTLYDLAGAPKLAGHPTALEITGNDLIHTLHGLETITSVGTDVTISRNALLVDLSGLDALTDIGGALTISNHFALQSLHGLEGLRHVTGVVSLDSNVALNSLNPLAQLASAGGLYVGGMRGLFTLQGLENLTTLGSLQVSSNDNLIALDGLENLATVTGNVSINTNGKLATIALPLLHSANRIDVTNNNAVTLLNLPALTQVTTAVVINGGTKLNRVTMQQLAGVGQSVELKSLASLTSTAFDSLANVGTDVIVTGNKELPTLSGFAALTNVGRNVTVSNNAKLANLALGAVNSVIGTINVQTNPLLPECQVTDLAVRLMKPANQVVTSGNDTAAICNTPMP